MGIETQSIIFGHIDAEDIASLIRKNVSGRVSIRDMQRPEYKIIEFETIEGSPSTINLFLDSWAADDYKDVYEGESVFLTADYSPQNFNLVRSITAVLGGLARKTSADPWVSFEPTKI